MSRIMLALSFFTVAIILSACNTMQGLGQDIENAGSSLKRSAEDNKSR